MQHQSFGSLYNNIDRPHDIHVKYRKHYSKPKETRFSTQIIRCIYIK